MVWLDNRNSTFKAFETSVEMPGEKNKSGETSSRPIGKVSPYFGFAVWWINRRERIDPQSH